MKKNIFLLLGCILFSFATVLYATQTIRSIFESVVKTEAGVRITLQKDDVVGHSKPGIYLNEKLIKLDLTNRDLHLKSKDKLKIVYEQTVWEISISDDANKGMLYIQHTTTYSKSDEITSESFYYPKK